MVIVVVARVISSLFGHQPVACCHWGWRVAWFRNGGHVGVTLLTRRLSLLGVEPLYLAVSGRGQCFCPMVMHMAAMGVVSSLMRGEPWKW
jgi:hypothetical protein